MKQFYLLVLSFCALISAYGQQNGEYRTKATGSGDWDSPSSWEKYNSWYNKWEPATAFPTHTTSAITIQNGFTVTVKKDVSVDQVKIISGGKVRVNSGSTLAIVDENNTGLIVDGTLEVDGTLINSRSITSSGIIKFNAGSTYIHNQDGETVPVATWDVKSNCNIIKLSTAYPSGMDQEFGNVLFKGNMYNNIGMNSNLTCKGDLTFELDTKFFLRLNTFYFNLSNTERLITVQGNFRTSFPPDYFFEGSLLCLSGSRGSTTLNVRGSFTIKDGGLILNENTGKATINIGGDFVMGSGATLQNANDLSSASINFDNTAIRTFSKTGGSILGAVPFIIKNGATVDFGTSILDGTKSSFTLEDGGSIRTANKDGLNISVNKGSVQVGGARSYSPGANYTFYGTVDQSTGDALTGAKNLTIDNSVGVTLSQSTTVSGIVKLEKGKLIIPAGKKLALTSPNPILGTFDNNKHIVTQVNASNGTRGVLEVVNITNTGYKFPVGTGTYYLPAFVRPASPSTFNVNVVNNISSGSNIVGLIREIGAKLIREKRNDLVDAIWNVNNVTSNGIVSTDLKLSWPEELKGSSIRGKKKSDNDIKIGISHYSEKDDEWDAIQGSEEDDNLCSVTRKGIKSFSPFMVYAIQTTSLPVQFTSFNVSKAISGVSVQWSTSEEINAHVFEVERSEDGRNWRTVGTVKAVGNSNIVNSYSYSDKTILNNIAYYRIKQVDIGGKFIYTQVKAVTSQGNMAGSTNNVSIYPANNNVIINFLKDVKGPVVVRLISFSGQVLAQQTFNQPSQQIVFNKTAVNKGNYIVFVSNNLDLTVSKQISL